MRHSLIILTAFTLMKALKIIIIVINNNYNDNNNNNFTLFPYTNLNQTEKRYSKTIQII